jgi:hypothetical protein
MPRTARLDRRDLMDEKGFFGRLFDMSFMEFVTIRIITILYALGIAGSVLVSTAFIVTGFSSGAGRGILFLILSPVVFLLCVLVVRIWCEMVIAMFRIAENTRHLVDQAGRQRPTSA